MEEFNEETLKAHINKLKHKELLILKFTASWCVPCKTIKPICDEYIQKLPEAISFYEIDIDESLELYVKLKKLKMINGVPALLAYSNQNKSNGLWYVPMFSHLGGNIANTRQFFNGCLRFVN